MRSTLAPFVTLLLACGCGGGGGDTPGIVEQTVAPLVAVTVEDASSVRSLARLRVGKEAGATLRAVLRFEIPTPPPGARLERATLEIHQRQGTPSTYAQLGDLIVESIEPGAAIDAGDAAIDGESVGILSVDDLVEMKSCDVTTHVRTQVGVGATYVDLRIQFEGDALSLTTPLFTELDQGSGGGDVSRIRWYWQLAY
ncbi:MAG: hypothetical protein QNJ98_04690 [Planctomycetota bacterium]|nr:hypothetical protein [Planctomycetota bacterium]